MERNGRLYIIAIWWREIGIVLIINKEKNGYIIDIVRYQIDIDITIDYITVHEYWLIIRSGRIWLVSTYKY